MKQADVALIIRHANRFSLQHENPTIEMYEPG
jgi:hypothetical protein